LSKKKKTNGTWSPASHPDLLGWRWFDQQWYSYLYEPHGHKSCNNHRAVVWYGDGYGYITQNEQGYCETIDEAKKMSEELIAKSIVKKQEQL